MSLQVWLPLNGNFLNHGIDVPVITNVGTVEYGAGKTGEFSLFSQTSCFYFPWTHAETNQFSFSAWVKGTDPWAWQDILSFGEGLNRIEIDNSLSTYRWYCTSSPALMTSGTAIFTLPKNEWHHITMTADGSYVTFYIDGSQASRHTQTNSVSSCFSTNQTVRIASRTDGGGSLWRGYINDVRLYDHALSQHEIERDYCSLLVHYPLRDPYIEDTTNLLGHPTPGTPVATNIGWNTALHPNAINVNGWTNGWNGGVTAAATTQHAYWNVIDNIPTMIMKDDGQIGWIGIVSSESTSVSLMNAIGVGGKYTLSFEAKSNVKGKQMHTGLYYTNSSGNTNFHDGTPTINLTTDWKTYSFTFTLGTNANLSKGGRVYVYGHTGNMAGTVYVRNYQLEAKDHATPYAASPRSNESVYDCSGRGHHSVERGNLTVSADSGRNSYCTNFPINNSIKFPSPYGATTTQLTDFSVAMWLKLADNAGRYKTVFSTWFGNNASGTMGWLGVNTENKDLWFYNGQYHGVGSGSYPLNEWHHIVMTYKNGAAQWYMDGEAYGSPISDTVGYVNAYEFFGLGDSYTSTGWGGANFTGSISDFRFYGTAIPATAVKDLYYNGATIDNANNIHTFEFVEV